MSYILDALKKADAERERRGVPGLHAQAAGLAGEERRSGGLLRWAAGAGALLLVAALAWWWVGVRDAAPVPPTATPSAPTAPAPQAPVAQAPAVQTPVVQAPVMQAPVMQAPATQTPPDAAVAPPRVIVPPAPPALVPSPAQAPPATAASAARSERVVALAQLSPELRRQLPPLTVSGAMYAPQPAARLIFINGQVFREGDTLTEGLVLERIGPASSVLSLRGTRFELKH
jgi:general secretion pathway protein B